MERIDYAKKINWIGTATRMVSTYELPEYKIGEKVNPGICWTDGGIFEPCDPGEFQILFRITEECEGHEVDYENEEEAWDLSASGCEEEKEILINREFEVIDFYKYDSETGCAEVFLKVL